MKTRVHPGYPHPVCGSVALDLALSCTLPLAPAGRLTPRWPSPMWGESPSCHDTSDTARQAQSPSWSSRKYRDGSLSAHGAAEETHHPCARDAAHDAQGPCPGNSPNSRCRQLPNEELRVCDPRQAHMWVSRIKMRGTAAPW